jgi:phenylalanyl-tRNA synthetase beta chain
MKISFNWLKSLINVDINVEETAALLTASGLEVEGIESFESVPGGFRGLVVGHILKCEKHPDADRLHVTQVDIGGGQILNIVCGAPNVAANQKVIVATVGTKLYPIKGEAFEIKKSKIRGAASEGMICAEDEIGLGESHAGIMILPDETPIGLPAADYFKIENDTVLEIGLTPNRSDATSHYGVARDLAAILNCTKKVSEYSATLNVQSQLGEASNLKKITIKVEDKDACKRYSGIVISGIQVKESPNWIQNRLKAIGIRPINNIVDITNYVLHEMGQPLHAFDYEKIKGQTVVIRRANENESFTTLDGIKRTLKNTDLVIANDSETLCLAGVFGGAESGVNENTTSIFLESAYFDAGSIRSSSKHHGLKTDASFRFERGTDPELTVTALTRAAQLIFEIAGGNLSMDVVDIYPEVLEPYQVAFSFQNCNNLIGKVIDNTTTKNILINLGIKISKEGNDGLLLSVPRYKTDVTREVDVIEEVMRIYGYNNIEVSKDISYTASHSGRNFDLELENKIGALLEYSGFNEMMNLSLSKESHYNSENLVKVVNPLSQDLNVLRADLLPSGLESIAYNLNRKNADLKLYEIGRTYQLAKGDELKYIETKQLSIFMCGNLFAENSFQYNQKTDFSALKSIVVSILSKLGISNYKTSESAYEYFEYGLSFTLNNKTLVEAGLVKSKTLKSFDISQPVFYANFNWDILVKAFSKQHIQFEELNKFPSVRRDLALLLDKSVKYQDLVDTAFGAERKLLKEVNLFDIFENQKLGGKKSYALSFTLSNSESTLTDKQIDAVMEKLIHQYKEKFQAELR